MTRPQPPVPTGLAPLRGSVAIGADAAAVAEAAATWLLAAAAAAISSGGDFHVALAGGSTPRAMYELLAGPMGTAADWPRWTIWFSDERAAAADDPASNYHLARSSLLDRVPIDSARIHRMHADADDLDAAADDYDRLLRRQLPAGPAGPRLDVALLGLGENGHTASLFPGDRSLEVDDELAVAARADYAPHDRITLTFVALNAAAAIAVVAVGEAKAAPLRAVREGSVPASRLSPRHGELRWFLDAAAAAGSR